MVIVYSKPNCGECEKTKNFLKKNGIDYQELSVLEPTTLKAVKALGMRSAPVVSTVGRIEEQTQSSVSRGEVWSGFNEERLKALLGDTQDDVFDF